MKIRRPRRAAGRNGRKPTSAHARRAVQLQMFAYSARLQAHQLRQHGAQLLLVDFARAMRIHIQ